MLDNFTIPPKGVTLFPTPLARYKWLLDMLESGYSQKDLAKMLGVSKTNVSTLNLRALKHLKN